jgi:hypothetical protein
MRQQTELSLMLQVKDGWLSMTPAQQTMIRAFLARMNLKDVSVRIGKPRKIRSLSQNAYYWAVVLSMISAQVGHTPEEVHYFLKDEFLPKKFIKLGGLEVEIRKTTTDLSTNEFNVYLAQVTAWASELGIEIPSSNQV